MLSAHHSSPEVDDPRALLRELEAAFVELITGVGLPDATWLGVDEVPVRICLRLKSARHPYATHTFTWRVEDAARSVFPTEQEGIPLNGDETTSSPELLHGGDSLTEDKKTIDAGSTAVAGSPGQPTVGESSLDPSPGSQSRNGHPPSSALAEPDDPDSKPLSDRAIALPDATIEPPTSLAWLQGGWSWMVAQILSLSQYWAYGLAAVIVLGSGIFAYALSRPCVVGGCDRIDHATEFYDDAQLQLGGSPDGEALRTAQSDLQAAIDLLIPIPHWSAYYETAQTNLRQYESDVAALNALIQAKDKGLEAANLSQDPPHPVERWVDVQLLWQQSIDLLETIPPESPASAYAQQKLAEYRDNHKAIGRRILAEEEAEANFSTAIQTGQLARQRMETAESLAGWQLAAKEWQAAIKGLSVIPRGTSAYGEAQDYLKDYRQQFAKASSRASLEENSTRFYQQAVHAAREAKAYEAKNQWTLAVTQWRQAVTSAQQISPESTLGSEAGALLEAYQPALTQAQNRLSTAVALQTLTQTIGTVCEGSATPCSVTEDPSQIQVTLSSQYAEPLRQAITPPAADGTFAFTNELSLPVQQLLEEIMTISHQIDRQVAIYDSHGGFVARYRPDLGGFIKN